MRVEPDPGKLARLTPQIDLLIEIVGDASAVERYPLPRGDLRQ